MTIPRSSCAVVRRDKLWLVIRSVKHGGKLEFPGGKAKRGEDPFDTAARELLEETGLVARDAAVMFVSEADGYECSTIRVWAPRTEIVSSPEGEACWVTTRALLANPVRPGHVRRVLKHEGL